MSYTDFKAGLQNANDYLDARHHISGTTAAGDDALRIVGKAEYSFTLREILCGILSGNGIKLPNIQLCLHANIAALLGIPNLQAELYGALNDLQGSLEEFMDHTKIDNVLGRLNGVLAEAQQLANMINFCGQPANPIAIPNMLENAFGSFLGAGKSIVDQIGTIAPDNVCACIGTGGFNSNVFQGGLLGQIANNIDAINLGSLSDAFMGSLRNDINQITGSIRNLIDFENNIFGAYTGGGSSFGGNDSGCNGQIGVMHNPNKNTFAQNARITSQVKSLYDVLAGYPVQYRYNTSRISERDPNGNNVNSAAEAPPVFSNLEQGEVIEYPNIFHLLFEPEFLSKLNEADNPIGNISTQTPVYDYCGNIIGYTNSVVQRTEATSEGTAPVIPDSPGYNAGGFTTSYETQTTDNLIGSQTSSGPTATGTSEEDSTKVNANLTSEKLIFLNQSGEIDCSQGSNFYKTINVDTEITITNVTQLKDRVQKIKLYIEHNDGTIIWPDSVYWPNNSLPAFNTLSVHTVELTSYNNGFFWLAENKQSYPLNIT